MSLINNMLNDLEERHALAGIQGDKVLGDLHVANERGFPDRAGSALHPVFLLLAGLLVCYLGYDFYGTLSVPASPQAPVQRTSGHEALQPTAIKSTAIAAAATPAGGLQEDLTLEFTSLRMDTSAFKTTLPPVALSTDADRSIVSQAEDTETALPASAANRLLHIGLTDLAGGSSVLINTTSSPDYSLFLLQKPDRLLVEVKGLEMPAGIVEAPYKSDVVARLRHSSRGNTGLLIFDLNRPVEVNSTDVREMPGGGYSLDIELLQEGEPGAALTEAGLQEKLPGSTTSTGGANPVSTTETLHQTFQKNASSNQDTPLLEEAMTAYRTGDVVHAIDLLYQLLTQDPRQLRVRTTLATMLIQQQDRRGAVKVLSQGLQLHPNNTDLIKLYTKLLFDAGQLDQALAWLRRAQPDIAMDPDYYALMAAVLQRGKDYPNSGELYRKLVAIRPANGVWWMGLGISLEGNGHSGEALQAYANARKDRTLAPDLVRYIDVRIKTIGG